MPISAGGNSERGHSNGALCIGRCIHRLRCRGGTSACRRVASSLLLGAIGVGIVYFLLYESNNSVTVAGAGTVLVNGRYPFSAQQGKSGIKGDTAEVESYYGRIARSGSLGAVPGWFGFTQTLLACVTLNI